MNAEKDLEVVHKKHAEFIKALLDQRPKADINKLRKEYDELLSKYYKKNFFV